MIKKKSNRCTKAARFALTPLAGLFALGLGTDSYAADTSAKADKADAYAIEEVVVTARRKEENLQAVPLAVTAMSAEQFERALISKTEDLRFSAPSLSITPSPFGSSVPAFTIRGQHQLESLITQDTSVGLYLNDFAIARPHGMNASMFDIESVQVVKGPQGTLFGRNTTGGAVLINTKRPTFDHIEGEVALTLGNYNQQTLTGILNLPISDTVAIRLGVQTNKHDGYTKNLFDGRKLDDADDQSFRISVLVKPNADLESLTVAQTFHQDTNGEGSKLVKFRPIYGAAATAAMNAAIAATSGDWHSVVNDTGYTTLTAANGGPGIKTDTTTVSNTTTYKLSDDLSLKNIIGYRDVKNYGTFDYDGSAALQVNSSGFIPNYGVFNSLNSLRGYQWSEEFQVLGKSLNNRLDWITGLYYFKEHGADNQVSELAGARTNTGTGTNKSHSIFAQGTYTPESMDRLSFTIGARKTWDDRELASHNRIQRAALDPAFICRLQATDASSARLNPCERVTTYSNSAPTYNLSMDYKITDDTLAYIAKRRGYRSGGIQLRTNLGIDPKYFEPEKVDDVEIGLKSTWALLGMPIRTNIAVYEQDYKNIQRTLSTSAIPGGPLVTFVYNAQKATVRGGELEVSVLPTKNLELSGYVSSTNAHYDQWLAPTGTGLPWVNPNSPTGALAQNSKFAFVPKTTASATVRYTLPLSSDIGKVAVQYNWYWQDEQQMTDLNDPFGVIPAYAISNASVEWKQVMSNPFDLRLWIKNLADKEYATGGTSVYTSSGLSTRILGAPRTVGLDLTYHF